MKRETSPQLSIDLQEAMFGWREAPKCRATVRLQGVCPGVFCTLGNDVLRDLIAYLGRKYNQMIGLLSAV